MHGATFTETTVSLIRILVATSVLPLLGTLAGKAMFDMKRKEGPIPVKISVSGHLAVFFITVVVLTLMGIPHASQPSNKENEKSIPTAPMKMEEK
jgi:hypothetical protein